MTKIWWLATGALLSVIACGACGKSSSKDASADAGPSSPEPSPGTGSIDCSASQNDASAQTQAIVDAANAFVATFTSAESVQFPFARPASSSAYVGSGNRLGEQYGSAIWSNYPVSDIPRPGVKRGDLTSAQLAAEDKLLQAALSGAGFTKLEQIMGADQALCDQGQNFTCGTAVYTIGIFGTPSTTAPWMIEFGGHHLGLNIVIDGSRASVAPALTGAQPAVYTAADGSSVRTLAAENDTAFALLDSLDATQKGQAITSSSIGDLVLGPSKFNGTDVPVPEGVKASTFSAAQKTLLLEVIKQWAGIIHSAYACAHLTDIQAALDDTYFLWSGPTTHGAGANGSSYYRVQGPKVWIEFSPQSGGPGGATPTTHVHTVYRDPSNEYGHTW